MSISATSWNSNYLYLAQNQQRRSSTQDSETSGSASAAQIAMMAMRAVANSAQTTEASASSASSAIDVTSQGRNSLASMFGAGLEIGSPPPPPPGEEMSGAASDFMQNLDTLLSAISSGDEEAAQTAADALQSALDGLSGASDASATAASDTETAETEEGGFLADLKALLAAVESGQTEAAEAAAAKISAGMQHAGGPGGPRGPVGPPPSSADRATAESLTTDLTSLFSAIEAGDTEAAQTAAASVQATLDGIAAASGSTESGEPASGFMADLTSLLSAVETGDLTTAQSVADTIVERMSQGPGGPMGPPPSGDGAADSSLADGIAALFSAVQSGDTEATESAATSLQTILDNFNASSATDHTASTDDPASALLSDLQGLLDALKSGDTSESKLWSVLTAYKENGSSAETVET